MVSRESPDLRQRGHAADRLREQRSQVAGLEGRALFFQAALQPPRSSMNGIVVPRDYIRRSAASHLSNQARLLSPPASLSSQQAIDPAGLPGPVHATGWWIASIAATVGLAASWNRGIPPP
jgi:hypothetical protein